MTWRHRKTRIHPKALHKRLYELIPKFECVPGCHDCCGAVVFTRWEWKQLPSKRTTDDEGSCPYVANDGRCSVYSRRPLLCRLFGTVDNFKMRCPHGCRPESLLTRNQTDMIMTTYYKLMERGGRSTLYGGILDRIEGPELIMRRTVNREQP